MKTNKIILIIAGEASGDLHGAGLMREMLQINSSIKFIGLGGPKMEQLGLRSLAPIKKLAVMGFWEVAKSLVFFFKLKKKVLQTIFISKPNQIILIDYPGFNLSIAKAVKKTLHIPIFYYISPQLWAWKEKRINLIKKYIDKMIVVFPFEKDWYKERGVKVKYFGHPIIETKEQYVFSALNYKESINVALCPGSRLQEVERHMPVLREFIKKYKPASNQTMNFYIIKAPNIEERLLQKHIKNVNVKIVDQPILEVFQKCHFGIVASGTASLESAITTRPLVVIYKMSWVSWYITKRFVKIPFACIVNILANKKIIPELLQTDLNIQNLTAVLDDFFNKASQKDYKETINKVINDLGDGDAYKKTAQYILNK